MKRHVEDKPPKGGWLGPPSTKGLAPLATAVGAKRGDWKWRKNDLTEKQERRHTKFQRAMKEADKQQDWGFSWK